MKLVYLNREIEIFGKLIIKHRFNYPNAVWEYLSGSVFSESEQKMVGLSTGIEAHKDKVTHFMDAHAVLSSNSKLNREVNELSTYEKDIMVRQIQILRNEGWGENPLISGEEMEKLLLRSYEWELLKLYFNLDADFPEYIESDDDLFNPNT
jgi:hypothetical protein